MRNFRILFVLILFALVSVSGAWAATSRSSKAGIQKRPQATALSPRLQVLQQLWVGFWTKEGCWIDPLGRCGLDGVSSQPQDSEEGCRIDPWGRCSPGS
jgi:hypothetical protein